MFDIGDLSSQQRIKLLQFFIALGVLVNFTGLFVTIIGPDGALYASIAKSMVVRNNFAELFVDGRDWLDKPHFPFWMAAISFKLFGFQTWAYKLPAVLFTMMAAGYTYKLATLFFSKEIGLLAALILLTSQHLIISDMDVRAEPYLTGLIIGSVYHFFKSQDKNWFWQLLIGSFWAACAVMTKGIFALIPVFGAIAISLIVIKNWKMLFNFRWLLAMLMVLFFITPELWCLYLQFDSHPEKVVFDQTNVSGIRFFFWDSQFGRFFNTGPYKKAGGDPTFFLHTTLWAFLPWSFLLCFAIVDFFRDLSKRLRQQDWICMCGAGLALLVLSASQFQLPHYVVIIFPFYAILTAQYLATLHNVKQLRITNAIQTGILFLLIALVTIIHSLFRPELAFYTMVLLLAILGLMFLLPKYTKGRFLLILRTAAVIIFVNIYFNLAYYPTLTTYQGDSQAAFWLNRNNLQNLPVVKVVNNFSYAIDFYTEKVVQDYWPGEEQKLPKAPYLLYGNKESLDALAQKGIVMQPKKSFNTYRITRMKLKFLNYKTRKDVVETAQIVLVR
ncbi:ArnT family glycosyltransferase [Pedobacter sp. JCM 36344]|uniref:ArnT family glycosyltransferase n=1 Tax=Pedobacter sp. JCM 36344 TaxID=3374280 RepID=UPI00397BEF00